MTADEAREFARRCYAARSSVEVDQILAEFTEAGRSEPPAISRVLGAAFDAEMDQLMGGGAR